MSHQYTIKRGQNVEQHKLSSVSKIAMSGATGIEITHLVSFVVPINYN